MSWLLLLACLSFAQLGGEPLPAPPPMPKAEAEPAETPPPTPVAESIALALGTTVWAEVKVSTEGPVMDLTRLSLSGYYKRELIQLVLMCAKAKKPLKEAVERRAKGAALAEIASGWGLDPGEMYDAALAVEELVDRHYLPRFPERTLRRERP